MKKRHKDKKIDKYLISANASEWRKFMKKNMLTVAIAAISVVNLILLMVMFFVMIPTFNKCNTLITKVASAVDLSIESTNKEEEQTDVSEWDPIKITFETKQTINLKRDEGDTGAHYAILESFTVSFNKKADDYDDAKASFQANSVYAEDIIKEVIAEYSMTTMDEKAIKEEALTRLQDIYNTKSIVSVSLGGFLFS